MARYIDADKLIAEYDRVHIGPAGGARKLIVEAPTADVVPKSEVDKTIAEWAYLHADVLNKLETSRAEVAREIFEEIYKLVASKIPMEIRPIFKDEGDFDGGFINGKRDALLDVLVLIAELKKKYTERLSND